MSDPVLDVWIPGQPLPKARPRLRRNGSTYTPARTKEAERNVQWNLLERRVRPLNGKLRVELRFSRRTKRRCDVDNLAKLVLDAANGVAWGDDSQIRALEAHVEYGVEDAGTRLRVWELR